MNVRSIPLVASCLLMGAVGFLAFDFAFDRPASAQAVPARAAGPYEFAVVGREGASTVFVLNAHTGQCWYRNTLPDDKWTDIGSPAVK